MFGVLSIIFGVFHHFIIKPLLESTAEGTHAADINAANKQLKLLTQQILTLSINSWLKLACMSGHTHIGT